MGLFDSFKKLIPLYWDIKGAQGLLSGPSAPTLPKYPTFRPDLDMQKALSAQEHEQATRIGAYSLSDFILIGGKPATYKGYLGG